MLINYIYIGVICDGGGGSIHTRHLVAAFDCLVAQALVGVRHGCLDLCCLDLYCLCCLDLYFPGFYFLAALELVLARLYFLVPPSFSPNNSKEEKISNLLRVVCVAACEFFCDYDFYENVPYI